MKTDRRLLSLLVLSVCLSIPGSPARGGVSPCPGDCNLDSEVAINELVLGVGIALGQNQLSQCPAFDRGGDGEVTIDDLLAGVSAALNGCAAEPTPTITNTIIVEATRTPIATITGTIIVDPTPTSTAVVTSEPTQTAEPTETGDPTETAEPTQTAEPTETGEPTETAEPTETVEPSHTASPTETAPPTPTPTTAASGTPSDLVVVIDGDEVRLAWMNPDPSGGFTQALVLRRLNAPVEGPEDPLATLIFLGNGAATTHPLGDLLPDVSEDDRTYHYAVYPCTAGGDCGSEPATATLTPTLTAALRGGGYVIHWRHASADVCTDQTHLGPAATTDSPDWWKSCDATCPVVGTVTATARQLNDTGRAESIAIGQAFDILRIPVGRVVSSEFCRNFTTAELMDLGPPIELSQDISFFVYDEGARCSASYDLINQVPAAGGNTAIIGHAGFPISCPVLGSLAWAEAAIFKPDGEGGNELVTRVTDDEWNDLLPSGPTALSATVDPTHVRLTWANGPAYPTVRLLRRLNTAVDGPNDPDAQVVYAGTADTVLEPLVTLLPSTPATSRFYHYAVYGCVGASCEQIGSQTLIAPTIVDALRGGGYVIFWRHATAQRCQDRTDFGPAATTTMPDWWKSCDANCPAGGPITAVARQISDVGMIEATAIGEAFDSRAIPIGRVISSEFCRTLQTAELMDFGPPIEQSDDLTFFVYDEDNRCAATFALIGQSPPPGSNTALISHAGNDCPPISSLAMGGAAIYKPSGPGAPVLIDTVNWEEWGTLP
jgi:phosphohistidine phosphatase SixA